MRRRIIGQAGSQRAHRGRTSHCSPFARLKADQAEGKVQNALGGLKDAIRKA
jgi:hypothetical protein